MKKIHSNIKQTSVQSSLLDRITDCAWRIMISVLLIGAIHFVRRIFIAERFSVPTNSMQPTLVPGDKIWVNKMLMGARIYKSFDFEDHAPLNCFRMPGSRKIRPGDVICFNYPHGYDDETKIEFKINYVYCKRVLGTPGDRIGATDGHLWNDKVLKPIGVLEEQESLRWTFDGFFIWSQSYDVFPQSGMDWNIKNWGPLTVPSKGLTVYLDDSSRELYRLVIEYETGRILDSTVKEYTFCENYYFAVGDNTSYSHDSRYWGFIPEDFIIGIVGGKKVNNKPVQLTIDN